MKLVVTYTHKLWKTCKYKLTHRVWSDTGVLSTKTVKLLPMINLDCVWHWLKKPVFIFYFFKLFSLFLLLFMSPIALFSIIHGFYCIISTIF